VVVPEANNAQSRMASLRLKYEILAKSKKQVRFLFPFDKQGAVNNLYQNATVVSTEYIDCGVLVEAIVDDKCYGMYENYIFVD
jgi:50S ribosomal subunit-associated GTPase HflX